MKTTTVIQFRSLDFGFERCALEAMLPTRTKTLDPGVIVQSGSNDSIEIWELNSVGEISLYAPNSWKFAPPRRRVFEQSFFKNNETWTSQEFDCPSGSFFTFEVACSQKTPKCHVEFWQDRESPNGMNKSHFICLTSLNLL